jgi:hypothetical protein
MSQVTAALTGIRGVRVNKTDVLTLTSNFGVCLAAMLIVQSA